MSDKSKCVRRRRQILDTDVGDENYTAQRERRRRRRIERNIKSYRHYKFSRPCVGTN